MVANVKSVSPISDEVLIMNVMFVLSFSSEESTKSRIESDSIGTPKNVPPHQETPTEQPVSLDKVTQQTEVSAMLCNPPESTSRQESYDSTASAR